MSTSLMSILIPASLVALAAPAAAASPVLPPHTRVPVMSVELIPSEPPPAPLGALVSWTASVSYARPGTLWYRFRVRAPGGDLHVARDFSPLATLDWAAIDGEGAYELEVTVRNLATGEIAAASALYPLTSRVTNGEPVISPTAHPLVFLYSAPPCPLGAQMRVQFHSSDGVSQSTPYQACRDGVSMNFYLAGLRPNMTYTVQHTVAGSSTVLAGPALPLATSGVAVTLAGYELMKSTEAPPSPGILLQSTLFQTTVATDLAGNLVWFYPGRLSSLTRPAPNGHFLGLVQTPNAGPSEQILREFDLAGVTVRETNAARINEQLALLGRRPIGGFHHEARALPDGKILALAGVEQILTDVQGPGDVDVLGDMILVLDSDLQVVWTWDAFDHLDPHRPAVLGETCSAATGGCPPFYLALQANDWLHGNSLQLTPDGNILYSSRHQDWILKIAYNNGAGSGEVLWRLGKDGDFRVDSTDPYPWFSHQHDPGFEPGDASTLMVFDNGNTRHGLDSAANSRGQVWQIDETHRVAKLLLNADLGGYSQALGSAQKLPNGNYHFTLGWLPNSSSQSVEVDPAGRIVYALQVQTQEYRSFRMADLYTPDD